MRWLPALVVGASVLATAAHASKTRETRTMYTHPDETCCAVLELRQYTLKPGKRDVLIDLFDKKFVEGQEDAGMTIVGQFRDVDALDRFVWLRGFADMPQRRQALETFYGGPVWQGNRDTANATMIDSDNVLLLRPATASSGFALQGLARDQRPAGIVVAHIHYVEQSLDAAALGNLERQTRAALRTPDAQLHAVLVSEHSQNTFPALPVRLGEEVVVLVAAFAEHATYEKHQNTLERIVRQNGVREVRQGERMRLSPTGQSLLRGVQP